jgi:hypothetical protein
MAHFAEIDENNIVINVLKVPDEHEHRGEEYLAVDCNLGGTWIQTSYNSREGIHYDENRVPTDKPALRMNYAIIGGHYDPEGDAFYPNKPIQNPSYILNKENYTWQAPIPVPTLPEEYSKETHTYLWDESTVSWYLFEIPSYINESPIDERMVL